LLHKRFNHGVAFLGNKIFVAGGTEKKCESFDLRVKVWEELPNADFDDFGWGVALISIKNRHMVAVGGRKHNSSYPYPERFLRLDCLKL
jgi:hypothetical protein